MLVFLRTDRSCKYTYCWEDGFGGACFVVVYVEADADEVVDVPIDPSKTGDVEGYLGG